MKKFRAARGVILRAGEFLSLLATLIFFFELTTANRYLPALDVNSASPAEQFKFFSQNNRTVVFLDYFVGREDTDNLYVGEGEPVLTKNLDRGFGLVYLHKIRENFLTTVWDHRAEDKSFALSGPVFIRNFEAEGLPYLEISAAPFTDSIADRTRCTERLLERTGLGWLRQYITSCMF